LPYGVRLKPSKLQKEVHPPEMTRCAYRPVFASNQPSDVIHALVQLAKVFGLRNLPHLRGASNPSTSGTCTLASPICSSISALSVFHAVTHSRRYPIPMSCLVIWRKAKLKPVLGYFESSPPFFTTSDVQASKASDSRAQGCLHCKSAAPQAQYVPSPCSLFVFLGTWQENNCTQHAILGVGAL
jgi:hypothetical protein